MSEFDRAPVFGTGVDDLNRRQFEDEYLTKLVQREFLEANERTLTERLAAAKTIASVDDQDDRIEILSTGGPFRAVTSENFGHPGVTAYRNPNLAEAMKVLGYVQRFGMGFPTARRWLREAGHPEMAFTITPSHVLVTVKSVAVPGPEPADVS